MSTLDNFILNLPLPFLDHWGYLILFLVTIAEAVPILGTFIPGHTIVMFSGFLAYLGVFRLDSAIAVASVGTVISDLLAYFIGWQFGHDFITRYGKYFFLNQARYEKTKNLVREHTGKTLVIGRFSPFTRAASAFIAGTSKIKFSKFIIFAVVGGIIWASSAVLVGYIFGQSFEIAAKYFGRFILMAVIAIVLLIWGYHWLNKKKHIFVKYHIFYLFLNGLSIYLFSKMLEDYFDRESIFKFDYWLDERMPVIWRPWLNQFMVFIANIFSPEVLSVAALLAAVYFLIKQQRLRSIFIFLSLGGGLIWGAVIKWLVNRPRPAGSLISETGLSFPSQHAIAAIIFFSLILFFFVEKIKTLWLKRLLILSSLLTIALIGFSRIYLKVHWFSDVIAGYALGLFWFSLLILSFRIITRLIKDYSGGFKLFKKNNP